MAEPRIVIGPDGEKYTLPAEATDQMISSYFKAIPAANAKDNPKARTWTDTVVDALPAVLGTTGAVIGGVGGTAFGVGIGGVPGAAGGATLGTGAGEAVKQLINRLRGAEAPNSAGEAAAGIAIPAIEAGVTTAVLGGTGKLVTNNVGPLLKKGGEMLVKSPSWRQLAGKGMVAAGEKLTPAAAQSVPVSAPKITLNALDFRRVAALKQSGMSEAAAVREVLNLRVKEAIAAAAKMTP